MSGTRLITLAFLLLGYLLLFCFWNWFHVRSVTNTLRNILMVFGRNVEQDEITCHEQEWQLCFSYFCCYLPLLYLTMILHLFRFSSVSRKPFGKYLWCTTGWCISCTWMITLAFLPLELLPLLVWMWFCVPSVTQKPFGIFWWYLIKM